MRHLPIILFLSAIACTSSTAREGEVGVRTLAFELPQSEVTFTLARAGEESPSAGGTELTAHRNRFGQSVKLTAGRYLAKSPQFDGVISLTLPDSEKSRYVLLVLPRRDGGCVIMPVADDVEHIGPGDRFLLNVTGSEIAVRMATRRSRLKPSESVILKAPQPPPADGRLEVEMLRLAGDEWIPFNSTYWPLDPKARSFVLVYPDPSTGKPRVRNLAEIP